MGKSIHKKEYITKNNRDFEIMSFDGEYYDSKEHNVLYALRHPILSLILTMKYIYHGFILVPTIDMPVYKRFTFSLPILFYSLIVYYIGVIINSVIYFHYANLTTILFGPFFLAFLYSALFYMAGRLLVLLLESIRVVRKDNIIIYTLLSILIYFGVFSMMFLSAFKI